MKHLIASLLIAIAAAGATFEEEPAGGGSCFERAPKCGDKRLMCLCYDTGWCNWSCQ